MIRFEHVTKRYNDKAAVHDLNLSIDQGELFVLVGTSGSGKTTTLKMVNSLVTPDEGTIYFNDQPLSAYNLRELRWDIGYVLQQIALFPTMTVAQNISLIPEMKHWPKAQVHHTVTELLDAVGLPAKEYRHRMPNELSGGEQQRIGILRALASKPPVVLMDEPFSALDPLSRTQLQDLVLQLHDQLKLTILFVTHDMPEAMKLGQRIGVMRNGELLQVGTPQEIANSPATAFVDSFFQTAKNDVLQTPLEELAALGTPSEALNALAGDVPLGDALKLLSDKQPVAVQTAHGVVSLDQAAVIQFLADCEADKDKTTQEETHDTL